MAKFAVLLLAAFAFHAASAAASAGGLVHYGYPDMSMGDYYGKTGYGYGTFGKYQGYGTYGQDFKQFEVQIQTLIRDLHRVFQTVSFDDVTAKQAFWHMIFEYAQQLEVIVEKLHQYVNYSTESDMYIFEQVVQNLRQYVWALKQFRSGQYSSVEMSTQFYMYVQKIAMEFERLIAGFEWSHGSFYNFVQEILVQYLSATHYLYKMMENIHEYPQYGSYGPYSRQYSGDKFYGGKYLSGKYGQYYGLGKYGQQYGSGMYGSGMYGSGMHGSGMYGSGMYRYGMYGYGYGLGQYGKGYGYGHQSQYGNQRYGQYWPFSQYSSYAY